MAYHHHMGTVIQAEDEVDRMMDSTSPWACCSTPAT